MKTENRKYILSIIQLIFWIILIYSLCQIVNWYIHNMKNEKIMEEISCSITVIEQEHNIESNVSKEINSYEVDFNTLKQTNRDTIAFIKVNGTQIEYPVVKTTNNEFYLKHSFDKKYNAVGWIFADYQNKFDGSDKNIVIYGHNRKNGTMFSSLKNTQTNFENNTEYLKFIKTLKNRSIQNFDIDVTEEDPILTLSTCANDNDYRVVLHARKTNITR